jgi:hypothetical protein
MMNRKHSFSVRKLVGTLFLFTFLAGFLCAESITIINPNCDSCVYNGKNIEITWTKTGQMPDTVSIILLKNGYPIINIANSAPNTGTYSWLVPANLLYGLKYRIRVKVNGMVNGTEISADSDLFIIQPYFKITNPKSGCRWQVTKTYTITWEWIGPIQEPLKIYIMEQKNTSSPQSLIGAFVPNTGSYTWTIPANLPADNYILTIDDFNNVPSWWWQSESFNIVLPITPILQKK